MDFNCLEGGWCKQAYRSPINIKFYKIYNHFRN